MKLQQTDSIKHARPDTDHQPDSQDEQTLDFSIVGIGASAGGLAAFEQLFTALPPDSGMAFVVIQHLSPPHKSILPEIIQRYTSMTVSQVTDGMEIKPDNIYVIPPGSDLALRDGYLKLLTPETTRGYRLPIDFFFRSLAKDQGSRAIGIVLSGTGSDGSLGLKTIKAEGGLTIAQQPETAEYADMPRNAIATKEVDFILPPPKMGELILKYVHHQIIEGYQRGEDDFQIPVGGLQKLYFLLRSKTGNDFSLYKQNTLLRRIERRMKICLAKNLDEYIVHLQEHPEEIEAIFKELLINVTYFFRDPEAYEALIEKAIHPIISVKRTTHAPIRIWVAGCSSGEEAYSIAIAVQEQIEALKAACKVQIYATDLDEEAILTARKGFYTDGSLENVSVERLQRFFHQQDEGYLIKKSIRDLVVFSTQNLISDPPFSKIDLLSCRNVLIYLEHELQNQLFLQFHYAMNPDGFLFLGTSESIGANNDLFAVIDRKHKLFRRKETTTRNRARTKTIPSFQKMAAPDKNSRLNRSLPGGLREWTEQALLEFHSPACVMIDQNHNILYIHGRTGKFLEPVAGETDSNLIRMAREGLKTELATAIHTVIQHKETVRREGIQVKTNGDYQPINLTVRTVNVPSAVGELIMVVFEEVQALPVETVTMVAHKRPVNKLVAELEKELKAKDEYLHTIIDELEDTNQDLKSTNEELQSANEEMQSSNEELETSKEELQSINEELSTINAELQNKNDELSGVNNDIYNLLVSTEIGTIFLNIDLQIRRYTPAIQRIYNFLPTDIGRPISHFVSNLDYAHLIDDIKLVLKTLVSKAVEVKAKDGTWYLINIRPYRTLENVIDGAVITFVDISWQKHEDQLRRMGTILRDSNDAVTVQDLNGKIQAWNRGATQIYGWTEAEALGMNTMDLIPKNKRTEMAAIYKRLSEGEKIRSFETQRHTSSGRVLDVLLTLTTLVNDANLPVGIATTERDITDRNQAVRRLHFENRALKAFYGWDKTVRQKNEKEVCRILVEDGGYRLAWFGRIDMHKTLSISPVAWSGLITDQPVPDQTLRNFARLIKKPVETALSSGRPVVVGNIPTDPAQSAWRKDALQGDFEAFAVFPIVETNPPEVLVVYAAESEAFIDVEVELLFAFSKRIAQTISSNWNEALEIGKST